MIPFIIIRALLLTFLTLSTSARPLADRSQAANGQTEPFGLIAIRSGSPLQYQSVVVSHGELFLSGNASDPYSFYGIIEWDGSLPVVTDPSRFQPQATGQLFLSTAKNSTAFVTTPKRDTGFSASGGHLLYKGQDGVVAVPDTRYGYQYSLKASSSAPNAIGIALRTVTQSGGTLGDFP